MPEFTFDSHRVKIQKLRYTVSAESETEARRLVAAGAVAGVADGPAVLLHAGELEPARPTWVATFDGAGCPVWTTSQHHGARRESLFCLPISSTAGAALGTDALI